MWKFSYEDAENGFRSEADIVKAAAYVDGKQVASAEPTKHTDCRQIYYNAEGKARLVHHAEGFALTLPWADFTPFYRFGALRSQYISDDHVLTVSRENKNPYGNTEKSWNIYLTEWVNRYIADDGFLAANGLRRTRPVEESETLLLNYTVLNYDIEVCDAGEMVRPFYNIAIIRKKGEAVNFYLLVMKSTKPSDALMTEIVRSFKEIGAFGTAKNQEEAFVCDVPAYWNDETKAYYEKLRTQKATSWGFFSSSMVDTTEGCFEKNGNRIESEYARISKATDYEYALMPTYTHISWDGFRHYFPTEHAQRFAGGNGFDGKPVLHFTYQFTTHNNTDLHAYTPMFDILRGKYDDLFEKLAQDIKAYHKPVLFRLNNEMNTDWTSYSGIVNLLDPDIFVMTWERLYAIFRRVGVDNTIWIFNPMARSTPFSNWGEYLSFLPSMDTVQALGLTGYEMGNGESLLPFEVIYKMLYEKNTPYFDNYPWVISEFGAGAGGEYIYRYEAQTWEKTERGRHADEQAKWIADMFRCLEHSDEPGYEYCKNIKGAIWFSVNDYGWVDGTWRVTNYFSLDDGVPKSLEAFKEGLKKTQ